MKARSGRLGLVAMLGVLVVAPAAALAHDIIPWGSYPSAGDVTVSTKAKRLLDKTFLGQVMTVALGPGLVDSFFELPVGNGLPSLYGTVTFLNPKRTKAKLSVDATALDLWSAQAEGVLRPYLERKGAVVQAITLTVQSAGGTATFKTKPSPIGPYHKATLAVTVKYRAVATLDSGITKKGIVTVSASSKGVYLGFPGD
jgi:hypothetical protein